MKNFWDFLLSNTGIVTGICGGVAAIAVFVNNLYSLRKLKSDLRKADLEYEKIRIELDDLRVKKEKEKSPIAMATFADIEKFGRGEIGRYYKDWDNHVAVKPAFPQHARSSPPRLSAFLIIPIAFLAVCVSTGISIYFYGWTILVYVAAGLLIPGGLAAGYFYLSEQKSSLREDVSRSRRRVSEIRNKLENAKDIIRP